ncbi:hypothetical protein ACTFIZ_010083 [Dictyostelium cf. discoideum]
MGSQFSVLNRKWLIERSIMIEKRKRRSNKLIKILMMGNENSAKSTFAKKVKSIYQSDKIENSDANSILPYIKLYLSNSFKDVIKFIQQHPQSPDTKPMVSTQLGIIAWDKLSSFNYIPFNFKPTKELAKYIYDICHDPLFKSYIYPIISSKREDAFYLIENCKRMSNDDYIPNDEDIIRCSKNNQSGVFDTKLEIGKSEFVFVDTGNQKCDRKKWVHQFEDVDIILFFLALDEFDLPPDEIKSQSQSVHDCYNKLHENILVFDEIVNNHFFSNTPVIVLFNKKEQLIEKLKTSTFSQHYPDYQSNSNNPNDIFSFISNQFKLRDHFPLNKRLFIHSFNSSDTNQIDFFQYVKKILEDTI